ncbi:MAG: cupredoxin domain-containing protein [Sandaracinaceae bacterium]|nr:cupredoxin domain-containing protein [Sandaracinaceae bacterium]
MKKLSLSLAALVGLASPSMPSAHAQEEAPVREIEIVVRGGYQPHRITIRRGERVRLRFVRQDWSSCTREVVFPTLGIRRELPVQAPVVVQLPVLEAGEHPFHCGMNMIRGTLVVE